MLQFIRSKAGSFYVKLLFVLLIGSFGIWGVGDFLRQTPHDTALISVGSERFQGDIIQQEFHRSLDRIRQRTGTALDPAQARALGLLDQTVDGLVADALFDQEAQRLHVAIGDAQIASSILAIPGLKGPDGKIDRAKFINGLAQARLTEQAFVKITRDELRRQAVGSVTTDTPVAPKALTDTLYGIRNEHRIADYVFLPASAVKDLPVPDDAALKGFYDKHPADYTAPEYRGFTALVVQTSDVAGSVKIDEDKVKAAYDERLGDYTQPETRHLLQMLLPDEKTADDAEKALAGGQDFAEVAKTIAKQDASTVDLGAVTKGDLPSEISAVAFEAKQDEVTKPVHSALGWHVLKVAGITAESVKSYDEVKQQLEADLRADAEKDALDTLSTKLDNELSSGADFAALAQKFNLKPITVASVDETAKDPSGNILSTLPIPAAPVLKKVFDTASGQASTLDEVTGGTGYYVIKVDSVTPPALRPFDTVKDKVKEAWLADQRTEKVAAQAKELADAVTPDMTLAKLAGARKLELKTTKPFTRANDKREAPIPSEIVTKLFAGALGAVASAAAPDGQYVAQLKEIQPASPSADPNATAQLKKQLEQELGTEILQEFQLALRDRYPVEVKHAEIDKLLGGGSDQ